MVRLPGHAGVKREGGGDMRAEKEGASVPVDIVRLCVCLCIVNMGVLRGRQRPTHSIRGPSAA